MGLGLSAAAGERDMQVLCNVERWLDIYFFGRDPGFTPTLHLVSSAFRNCVGEIMLGIPYGKTMAYGEIARIIANERGIGHMSSQAVGGAVGKNPISLIIPCHRVIGSDGSLTGYGGGFERKAALLKLERGLECSLQGPEMSTQRAYQTHFYDSLVHQVRSNQAVACLLFRVRF